MEKICAFGAAAFEKEAWMLTILFEEGGCGFNIGFLNADPIDAVPALATVYYCSAAAAPGTSKMPTGPVSKNAMVITSLFVEPVFASTGMEALLIDAALMDMMDNNISAVEAFGLREEFSFEDLDSQLKPIVDKNLDIGLIPLQVLESAGFEIIVDHPILPRLRIELPPPFGLLSAAQAELLLAGVDAG